MSCKDCVYDLGEFQVSCSAVNGMPITLATIKFPNLFFINDNPAGASNIFIELFFLETVVNIRAVAYQVVDNIDFFNLNENYCYKVKIKYIENGNYKYCKHTENGIEYDTFKFCTKPSINQPQYQ